LDGQEGRGSATLIFAWGDHIEATGKFSRDVGPIPFDTSSEVIGTTTDRNRGSITTSVPAVHLARLIAAFRIRNRVYIVNSVIARAKNSHVGA
jgi:hypothetical protein